MVTEKTKEKAQVEALDKQALRQEMRRRKEAHSKEEREALSADITACLRKDAHWSAAQTILLYHSLPDEVNTHHLLHDAVIEGKRVLLPVVVGDNLELRLFKPLDQMHEGAFHILEPEGETFAEEQAIDLVIVPGVAFTKDGRRLGRGRGYYDRLLTRLAGVYKIGICWPFQLLDDLPTEPHDIRLDDVISVSMEATFATNQ